MIWKLLEFMKGSISFGNGRNGHC